MSKATDAEHENQAGCGGPVLPKLTRMPPKVAPEHYQIIINAENSLEQYEETLTVKLKSTLFSGGWDMTPDTVRQLERDFHGDPVRQMLIKNLAEVKLLCEKPRFTIERTRYT